MSTVIVLIHLKKSSQYWLWNYSLFGIDHKYEIGSSIFNFDINDEKLSKNNDNFKSNALLNNKIEETNIPIKICKIDQDETDKSNNEFVSDFNNSSQHKEVIDYQDKYKQNQIVSQAMQKYFEKEESCQLLPLKHDSSSKSTAWVEKLIDDQSAFINLSWETKNKLMIKSLILEVISIDKGIIFELDQDDLLKVFGKFGTWISAIIDNSFTKATIVMKDQKDFEKAFQFLNNIKFQSYNAYITLNKVFDEVDSLLSINMKNDKFFVYKKWEVVKPAHKVINSDFSKASEDTYKHIIKKNGKSLLTEESQQAGMSKDWGSVTKFTWKYEIQIKNIPGFCVARKIIGFKGRNMKEILNKLRVNSFKGPIQDVIKLRLRGQGSGFKEGPKNIESSEPLHLCISSKYYEKYIEAWKLAEYLLRDVYCEYNNYCKYVGIPTQQYIIKKKENNPASAFSNF